LAIDQDYLIEDLIGVDQNVGKWKIIQFNKPRVRKKNRNLIEINFPFSRFGYSWRWTNGKLDRNVGK
jgi:hypothetical protein